MKSRFHFNFKRSLIGFLLSLTIVWLFWAQQENYFLGELAKITSGALFVMLSITIILYRPEIAKQSATAFAYLIAAFLLLLVSFSASNMLEAVLLKTQWLGMLISTALIVSFVRHPSDVEYIFKSIGMGYVAVLISMLFITVTSNDIFWRGRITFGGINANQASSAAVLGSLLLAYLTLKTQSKFWSVFLFLMTATVLMISFFASRQNFIGGSFGILILILLSNQKVKILVAFSLIIFLLIPFAGLERVLALVDFFELDANRLISDDSFGKRFEYTTLPYIGLFLERPFFGIIGANENWGQSKSLFFHPHNAIMSLLYFGGIIFGGPVILINLIALLRVIWSRIIASGYSGNAELNLLLAIIVSVKFQWIFSSRMHHPTFDIAFVYGISVFMALSISRKFVFGRAMRQNSRPSDLRELRHSE